MPRKKKKVAHNTLPYSKDIEDRLRDGIKHGLTMDVILDSIQSLPHAPKSKTTLLSKYRDAIAEERAEFHMFLGGEARKRIVDGSDKILELALRAKAGWNPSVKVEEVDPNEPDEDTDAMSLLAAKLGLDDDDTP